MWVGPGPPPLAARMTEEPGTGALTLPKELIPPVREEVTLSSEAPLRPESKTPSAPGLTPAVRALLTRLVTVALVKLPWRRVEPERAELSSAVLASGEAS